MYSESPLKDGLLVVKAIATNQLARWLPSLYMRLKGETGRGFEQASPASVAQYFLDCVDEYCGQLGVQPAHAEEFLRGKRVLEYGPGDVLGVALLLYAYGAEKVDCVDRFPLRVDSETNAAVYRELIDRLDGARRARAESAFVVSGDVASGLRPEAVSYSVTEQGLSGASAEYDLVLSRAVLEHVSDLGATFRDVACALKPKGLSLHQVDLRSHGLDRHVPFDFLTWPTGVYRMMHGSKGFPNRWRVDAYREVTIKAGLAIDHMTPLGRISPEEVRRIRPHLAAEFRAVDDDELSWVGFWMLLRREAEGRA